MRAGMGVLRLLTTLMTLPSVSMPRLSGVTSTSTRLAVCALRAPLRMAPCTAAPQATASSGLMLLHSSLPPKYSESMAGTLGMRVLPPTSTTSATCSGCARASLSTALTVSMHLTKWWLFRSSNLARVTIICRSMPS